MEQPSAFDIRDIMYDLAFTHLDRFKQLKNDINNPEYSYMKEDLKNRLSADISFYNLDITEVYEIANEILSKNELEKVINMIREQFNIYMYDILTPKHHE